LLTTIKNPNQDLYPEQYIYIIDISGYIWLVPHEIRENIIRLITCYPSRKMSKLWLKENKNEKR